MVDVGTGSPACEFCHIADGRAEAHRLRETESTVAFLDVNPAVTGHTPVAPKPHVEDIVAADPGLSVAVFAATRTIAGLLKRRSTSTATRNRESPAATSTTSGAPPSPSESARPGDHSGRASASRSMGWSGFVSPSRSPSWVRQEAPGATGAPGVSLTCSNNRRPMARLIE